MFNYSVPIAPHSLPPNPSLVAIALIITTRRGPRFVFHYPAVPEASQQTNSWAFGSIGSDNDDSDETSDEEGTATSDPDDTASRTGSISSTKDGLSRQGSASGRTGRWSAASASTKRTTRTFREDDPEDEEDADDDIEALDLTSTEGRNGKKETKAVEEKVGSGDKPGLPEWEKLFGYPTEGLEKLLSPPDKFRKKKFEVTIEELVFLGYPVYAKADGTWKKKDKKAKAKGKHHGAAFDPDDHGLATEKNPYSISERRQGHPSDGLNVSAFQSMDISSPELSPTTTRDDFTRSGASDALAQPLDEVAHSYASTGGMSEAASEGKTLSTTSGGLSGDDMSMFHVVFVLNPPTLEYQIRVQEMYDNVVKKFSKALKYEQTRSGWVEKEAKKILTLKNQAKDSSSTPVPMSVLWARIIQQCPLAKAMANIYTSIAANKIAHVAIGNSFDASIQIPQAISTSYVATPMEPQLPGLWLTTASMMEDDDGVPTLSPHAALLLLEDKEMILKEIEGDNKDLATPLTYFIRELNPTKSLQKLSASLSLTLPDMQFLARHLIYWRRARAVPPLHIRDTYIVSPNCDLKQLSRATTLYAQRFSALPSLPSMLQLLSAKPKQYGYLIPSKDHKPAYMEILAWLLRGGWVTQLRTFAWVRVTPAVKAAAAVQIRKEAEEKAAAKNKAVGPRPDVSGLRREDNLRSVSSASLPGHRTYSEEGYISSASTSRKSSSSRISPRLDAILSPTTRTTRDHSTSDTESIASARTAIPPSAPMRLPSPALVPLRPSPLHTVDNINPLSSRHNSTENNSIHTAPEPDAISVSAASVPVDAPATDAGAETLFSDTITSLTTLTTLPSTEEADYETTLVLSPHKANTLESKWLAYIGANLRDQELREVWSTLVKYFDGRKAIEEIASREGWKRRRVDSLMARLEQEGWLCVVRHW